MFKARQNINCIRVQYALLLLCSLAHINTAYEETCCSTEVVEKENAVIRFSETRGMMTALAEEGREELSLSSTCIKQGSLSIC